MKRDATFDPTGTYRYVLTRQWEPRGRRLAFVLLNPSTADHRRDDPTIRRCMGFARSWGFGRLEVVNLFAFRATLPADLRRAVDPVGRENDRHLRAACRRAELAIAAWGVHGAWRARDEQVLALLRGGPTPLRCLGLTRDGLPRHVLYLRGDTPLVPFTGLAA